MKSAYTDSSCDHRRAWWRHLPSLSSAGVAAASALYGGCATGSTPERAINKAIYDAEISAEGDGLFTCTIVGEPTVWLVPNAADHGGLTAT